MFGNTKSNKPQINRRRGTASRGGGTCSPLRRIIMGLLLTAIALTSGLLSLFFLTDSSSSTAVDTTSPTQTGRAGNVQNLLRHVKDRAVDVANQARHRGTAAAGVDATNHAHHPAAHTRLRTTDGGGGGGGVTVPGPVHDEIDLGRYDTPPVSAYPYPLEPVAADYDIHKQYEVLGGKRFSEYTTGGTPYTVTDDIRQQSDTTARSRRTFVKAAMQHAWNGYSKYAFGQDEVLPQSGKGSQNWGGQGITLVDSLDTLWLMDLKEEFWKGRDWVRDHLSHEHVGSVSVFETTIRDLGGLLAAYDWSGDQVFLTKAQDLGNRLLHAFDNSPTGIPHGQVNLQTAVGGNIGWAGGNVIVAEFGTLQLENRYLSKMTGQEDFAQKTEHVFEVLNKMSKPNGLFPYFFRNNPKTGDMPEFANDKLTFGAMADSVYEYMLKIWIQGGKKEPMYREMYDKAIEGMHNELLQTSTPSGLTYIADKNNGKIDHKMDHLVCFMGGLLALGAYTDPLGLESSRAQRDLRTAKALTYTCYQMYARMNTGISAEYVQFYPGKDLEIGRGAPHYLLRPEAVESFFILNQFTGDPVYREWGWEVFQSIEKYCRTKYAYGALSNVQDTAGAPRDKMESFFLAETLKYLYLLQDPDTEVDVLNKHVFNTEAHPMRIFPVIDAE
jgi:hypothetical protein